MIHDILAGQNTFVTVLPPFVFLWWTVHRVVRHVEAIDVIDYVSPTHYWIYFVNKKLQNKCEKQLEIQTENF